MQRTVAIDRDHTMSLMGWLLDSSDCRQFSRANTLRWWVVLHLFKKVRDGLARRFRRIHCDLGPLFRACRYVFSCIRGCMAGKFEGMLGAISRLDHQLLSPTIDFLHGPLSFLQPLIAHSVDLQCSVLGPALGIMRHNFRAFFHSMPGILACSTNAFGPMNAGFFRPVNGMLDTISSLDGNGLRTFVDLGNRSVDRGHNVFIGESEQSKSQYQKRYSDCFHCDFPS